MRVLIAINGTVKRGTSASRLPKLPSSLAGMLYVLLISVRTLAIRLMILALTLASVL